MPVNAGTLLQKPEKEGSKRTAARFHQNLPLGRLWGRRLRALLPASGFRPHIQSQNYAAGSRPPEAVPINAGALLLKADKEGFERAATSLFRVIRKAGCGAVAIGHCFRRTKINDE
jgi:hypothetical protein